MKKILVLMAALFLSAAAGSAQSIERVYLSADSLSLVVDTVRVVTDSISKFDQLMMQVGGRVQMTPAVENQLQKQVEANASRQVNGYRLRIYFDNKQAARRESEAVAIEFLIRYPQVPVYRSYVNPYFKVTVGDFRTKSDALQFMEKIRSAYPAAFLVRESIVTQE